MPSTQNPKWACARQVLVHCALGANRSATIVLAWLISRRRKTLIGAMQLVWRCRPCVAPWPQNISFLLMYEKAALGGPGGSELKDYDPELLKERDQASWLFRHGSQTYCIDTTV
jgi:hypothetical protein